jgi:Fe-S oxidoreductase
VPADVNPMRTCIGCEQTDDHPRDVVALPDGSEVTWHMDCHVIATGCETCKAQLADAGKAKGDKLRQHLITKDG